MESATPANGEAAARRLFEQFVAGRQRGAGDGDLDALCAAHPSHAAALRRFHDEWLWLSGVIEQGAAPSLADALRQKFGSSVDPRVGLEPEDGSGAPDHGTLRRLADPERGRTRYRVEGELARGGMGIVYKVYDPDFRRRLAMKVIAPRALERGQAVDSRAVLRFLEEAQITGQLNHPGIVPVHDLGIDGDGRVFFTMKLVRGQDLRRVFDAVRSAADGWTEVRALQAIYRVCEAMAFAHERGVVHRDLKPSNVMVGRFGETYVMDWGLARVLGREDVKDVRLAPEHATISLPVSTERSESITHDPEAPLVTMDGDVVGTPAYMAPEQAEGRTERVGPQSDVYSVGAILYQLVARQMPYVTPGAKLSPRTVLSMVLQGPPASLAELAPEAPPELIAIVEKAMARKAEARYPNMIAMAEDLRAYLEGRVVRAYQTGALAELRSWVRRNTGTFAAAAALIAAVVLGLTALWLSDRRGEQRAESERAVAVEQRALAEERLADVTRWSDFVRTSDFAARAAELAPPTEATEERLEALLAEIREVAAREALHRAELSAAAPDDPRRARFEALVDRIAGLSEQETGLAAAIERRLASIRAAEATSLEDAAEDWRRAQAAVLAEPRYRGLALAPQRNLVPIGADPESGLQEFWHVLTGARPARDEAGDLLMEPGSGMVLVLLPGGTAELGAQAADPAAPFYDLEAENLMSPRRTLELSPLLVSKYEMTQAQWLAATGVNPSQFSPAMVRGARPFTLLNPVELVSCSDCQRVLADLGLRLPTESEWEYAARAGSTASWLVGSSIDGDDEPLRYYANLADEGTRTMWPSGRPYEPGYADDFVAHAPVGSFMPNRFGLCEVAGNVAEWCLQDDDPEAGTVGYGGGGQRMAATRGGSFDTVAKHARSAWLTYQMKPSVFQDVGVRPVLDIADR